MKTAKDLELLLLIKEHEKQKLQLRINKAIEYIKDNIIDFDFVNSEYPNRKNKIDLELSEEIIKDLLDILNGDDNNGKN